MDARFLTSKPGRRALAGAAVSLLAISACTSSLASTSNRSPVAIATVEPPPGPLGAPGCSPPSPSGSFPAEVYGTAANGTVWAWFQSDYPPRHGVEDKTVWRLGGEPATGEPELLLVGPGGAQGRLDWGPEAHGGSTWNRPGAEFGTGLMFPASGCWDVNITLGKLHGDVYVVVT